MGRELLSHSTGWIFAFHTDGYSAYPSQTAFVSIRGFVEAHVGLTRAAAEWAEIGFISFDPAFGPRVSFEPWETGLINHMLGFTVAVYVHKGKVKGWWSLQRWGEPRTSTESMAAEQLEPQSERAYVVYDGETGAIVHLHRILVYDDDSDRWTAESNQSAAEAERGEAIELAQRLGYVNKELRVIRVEPSDIDPEHPQRVDPNERRLVDDRRRGDMQISFGGPGRPRRV